MWWKTIFRPRPDVEVPSSLWDEQFMRRLERLALLSSKRLRGGMTGVHTSQRRLPAPTVSDHRPYTHGDDLRYVDWSAYARQEDLHIKMGEAEQELRVHQLLDGSASMEYGEGNQHKFYVARQLAAAVGYCALAHGDQLAVQVFGGAGRPHFSAGSRQYAPRLLQFLGGVATGGRSDLSAVLQRLAATRRGGLVVIISDLWHTEGLEAALRLLTPPRWQIVVLHLLHPTELSPELVGDVELEDSETGATESLHIDAAARARYDQRLQAWCEKLESLFIGRGITYALLSTNEPLEKKILPYLQARQVLG